MQIRSNLFSELAMSGNAKMETSVTIGGHAYAPGSAVTVSRAAGQNALSVGNAISAAVRFSLAAADLESADIPRTAAAVVKCRFADGRRVSEWLAVGTFYVTRRTNDPVNGLFEFQGFDAMQKANAPFPALSGFPKAMNSAVMEIASEMGAEVDGRTWGNIPTGGDFYVPLPSDNMK
ncbi:MAG: hypothetical protein IJK52_04685, partial [Oscillospiraceae bacterium]|nr:hypothetical protein [Oscillospiraceae bacterium]